jgi:sortase A
MPEIPLSNPPAPGQAALSKPAASADRLGLARPGSPSGLSSSVLSSGVDRRPRRGPRRAWRALSWVLILVGVLALSDAAVTLFWQEPLSALYARIQQDRLSGALHQVELAQPTPVERRQLSSLPAQRQRIAFLARELQRHAGKGSPVGTIHIPRLGIAYVVVNGTGVSELQKGPGVFPETHFPGIAGTTAIAGHRTTYLAPFRHIDSLRRGDRILLNMPYAHFTYVVSGHRVVSPSNVGAAVNSVGYSRLVLSACTPLFSAAQRLLVFARLTNTVPIGAARLPVTRAPVLPLTSDARIPSVLAAGRAPATPPPVAPAARTPPPAPPT